MINSQAANSATAVNFVEAQNAANTAAATSGWVDILDYDGFLIFVQSVGTITAGTLTGKIQDADDNAGANAADVTGGGFVAVTTSTDHPNVQKVVLEANAMRRYVAYIGTIATGPADVACVMVGAKKYVP